MKKYLLLLTVFLLSGNVFAKNKKVVKDKFSEITITMKDGQVKSGKVKHPYNLNKKIVLIPDSGKSEKVNVDLIDEVLIKNENGISISFKSIKFKNVFSEKISKNAKLMLVVMKGLLTVYYDNGVSYTHMSSYGMVSSHSYISYYVKREGEDVATIISGYMTGQINPNNVFKKSAVKYFEDYPELCKKIEDKIYKYDDIINVCIDYINWKKSKN